LARVKETDVAGDIHTAVARVVDQALPPLLPVWPQKLKITLIALVAALAGSSLLAMALNRLDDTINTVDAIEEQLGAPALGALPRLTKDQQSRASPLLLDPRSAFAEAIRTINTGILLSTLDEPHKVIAITSTLPQEGKSTIALNLAFSHGRTRRVLLVDGDLRRPALARRLGLPEATPGLTDLLTNPGEDFAILELDGVDLSVLPAGRIPPNPLELLSSTRFHDTVQTLRANYDVIII